MVFGLFVERNPQAELVNEKFDEFVTLRWKYKTGYNISMVILLAPFGGMICSAFVGSIFLILSKNSEIINFSYFISFVLGTILSGLFVYNKSYGIPKILILKDGNYVSAGSKDGNVYFFNKEGRLLWEKKVDGNHISSSFDGSYTAVGSEKKFKLIDVNGNLLWDFGYRTGGLFGGDTWIKGVSISAAGSYIAAVFDWSDYEGWAALNKIFFFDNQRNRLWDFDMNTYGTIIRVTISSDGSAVAVVRDNGVLFFNKEGKLLWEYKKDKIKGGSISSDGLHVAIISNDEVYLLNREGRSLWDNRTDGMIECVSISSDGSHIAAGLDDNEIYFFNKDGDLLWRYKTDGAIQSIAISSDCSFIIAGSKDNRVYFFNRDGVLLWKYKTGGEINSVSISPDGSYIAVGSQDKEIYFFKFDI